MVKRQIQNFDYYSKYNGETGIQFTAFSEGDVAYIFSMWTGYSDFLFQKLFKNQDQGFPVFLKAHSSFKPSFIFGPLTTILLK